MPARTHNRMRAHPNPLPNPLQSAPIHPLNPLSNPLSAAPIHPLNPLSNPLSAAF